MLGRSPSFLAVRGNMPVKNYEEFKTFAKGAKLSVGHPGNGTNPQIAGAALARSLGVDAVEIAFKGGTPLATALASGDIDFAMVDYQSTRGLVDKGAIKLLAAPAENRSHRPARMRRCCPHQRPLWPRSGLTYCTVERQLSDEPDAVRAARFFGAATAADGRHQPLPLSAENDTELYLWHFT